MVGLPSSRFCGVGWREYYVQLICNVGDCNVTALIAITCGGVTSICATSDAKDCVQATEDLLIMRQLSGQAQCATSFAAV